MSQYVCWYDSSETGAPTLNNAAGALVSVLDACLVTGFNPKSITSLVVAGGVATATCAGHGYSGTYGKDVEIAGATPAGLNGRKALLSVATDTFTFDAAGISDQTATGTITAKRSPLGWSKQYGSATKAIYKRNDPAATSVMLRVDDTNAAPATTTDARVVMVESATDVDTYTAPSPTAAQLSGGQYWNRGASNATPKQWTLVGDGKRFFLVTQQGTVVLPAANQPASPHFFGDFTSLKAGDAYNTALFGSASAFAAGAGSPRLGDSTTPVSTAYGGVCARAYTQIAASPPVSTQGVGSDPSGYSGSTTAPIYPSPVDAGAVMMPGMVLREYDASFNSPARGILKPMVYFLAKYPFSHHQVIDGIDNLPGRKVIALAGSISNNAAQVGVDLTGPWD